MTETTAEATPSVNGTAPAGEAPCEDCVSAGEKGLAVLAILFGAFVIVMGLDMFSGGKLTGYIAERRGD